MNSINENLWNEIEFNASADLNNDECWNHTNNCIDWCHHTDLWDVLPVVLISKIYELIGRKMLVNSYNQQLM